ncbi:copper homeostasis protein [Bacillus manliponensis]|uniref:PF03932 family protein CutC n=1 Tax=Bacillus manliponensis TaxID=574376 RepID=A0A073JUZ7_9BACI|nr:copper homeostasis protein CutC [Bacillus manliponensis]KEK17996.1 copper homeostasis protein [Bacillus manliponensis]
MLEVIATCIEDVKRIEQAGGGRIELISAYTEGGLTPSYAFIKKAVEAVHIPVHVMIRPHAKSFVYTSEEIEMMKEDIEIAKKHGAAGVVLGVLNEKSEIDEEALAQLLAATDGINVTFHRAIDETKDLVQAIEVLKKFPNVTHVLTSGGQGAIEANVAVLQDMQRVCEGQMQLIVGSGVTKGNIQKLLHKTGIKQAHVGTAARENQSAFGEISLEKVNALVNLLK